MTASNQPHPYPLRHISPRFDLKMANPGAKVDGNWVQRDYQKFSVVSQELQTRESRKRIRKSSGLDSNELVDEREDSDSCEDVTMSDAEGQVSSHSVILSGLSSLRENGKVHPPKRRLTAVLSPTNTATPAVYGDMISSSEETAHSNAQSQDKPAAKNTRNAPVVSPTHTPVSDMEEQLQQLPLPSPSASPVQSANEDYGMCISLENHLSEVPDTEKELLDMIINLSGYIQEKNRNFLIFKLLQNVKRSHLSTFNDMIQYSLRRDLLSNLPLEVSYKILSFLDYKSLCSVSRVCKNWNKIINNSGIWIQLLKLDKLMADDYSIQKELSKSEELVREWSDKTNRQENNIPQLLYKKRRTILKRWMDPKYKPKRISVFGHGSNVVTCLQHDEEKIITGVEDKFINIYSTKTGELLNVLNGHEGGVWALKYTGNTLVTGSVDRTVRIWNIKTGKCTHIFKGHTSTVRCLDIMHPTKIGIDDNGEDIIYPKEPLLVTGSRDHNLIVWKLPLNNEDDTLGDNIKEPQVFDNNESENPYLVTVLSGHTQSVRSVSAYGNIIVSGSYDTTVRVWDLLDNGRCRHVLADHADKIYSTVLDFQNKICYSGSMDSFINVWDIEKGKLIRCLEGHTSLVGLLGLSEEYLVSAAADSTLGVWDKETGENLHKLKGHGGPITCFQHDCHRVVSGSEKMLKLWDIKTGNFVRDMLNDIAGGTWQVRFDSDRCIAAVQRSDDDIQETFIEILDFSDPLNKS